MKKTLVALAALAATASFAQSSVQIIGVLDIGVQAASAPATVTTAPVITTYTPVSSTVTTATYTGSATGAASNASLTRVAQNGVSTSAIKFVGSEDIGGGLKAGFLLEINPNLVQSSTSNQANAFASEYTGTPFNGEQFINLSGNFGDVKLGVPNAGMLDTMSIAQPFGTALGSFYSAGTAMGRLGTVAPGIVSGVNSGSARIIRHERSVQYVTPTFSGFKASFTYAAPNDNTSALANQDGYQDITAMYSNGPLNVAYTNAVNKFGNNPVLTLGGAYANVGVTSGNSTTYALGVLATPNSVGSKIVNGDYTYNALAANYTMGATTVYAGYTTTKSNGGVVAEDASSYNVAAKYVMGSIDLLGNYTVRFSNLTTANNASVLGLGANYNLSKRTSVYYRYELADQNLDSKAATAGGSVTSVNAIGLRHVF